MGLAGRYDFPGIKKAASAGINTLLAATSWGAWLLASPFRPALNILEGLAVTWLTNRGLIVFNVGAVLVNGKVNQVKLDNALDSAFDKLKVGRDKITPAEGAKIDADTDAAFDQFADVPVNDGVLDIPGPSV
jgi:hypothetical protein